MRSIPEALRWPAAITVGAAVVIVAALVYFAPSVEITTAIIGGSVTVLGGALLLAVGRHFDTTRELEAHLRQRKSDEYEAFIAFMFRLLYAQKLVERQPTPAAMMKAFVEFTETLTIWGSDDLIREWGEIRQRFMAAGEDPSRARETVFDFERLLIAIRRDAGNPDTTIGRGEILSLFIDDVKTLETPKP